MNSQITPPVSYIFCLYLNFPPVDSQYFTRHQINNSLELSLLLVVVLPHPPPLLPHYVEAPVQTHIHQAQPTSKCQTLSFMYNFTFYMHKLMNKILFKLTLKYCQCFTISSIQTAFKSSIQNITWKSPLQSLSVNVLKFYNKI